MDTNWLEFIITGLVAWAAWELRQLRHDVAAKVNHHECNRRMSDHRDRIARLEVRRFHAGVLLLAAASLVAIASGCGLTSHKALAVATGVDAIKIESAGGAATGTPLPNLILGGALTCYASAPALSEGETNPVVFSHARRTTLLGTLFGLEDGTETTVYIGAPGESAEETRLRLTALGVYNAQ